MVKAPENDRVFVDPLDAATVHLRYAAAVFRAVGRSRGDLMDAAMYAWETAPKLDYEDEDDDEYFARRERQDHVGEFQQQVGQWADATFPFSNRETRIKHLAEELGELYDAAAAHGGKEVADKAAGGAVLMLLHIAYAEGVDVQAVMREDLLNAAVTQFLVDQQATYELDPVAGYMKKVKA